MNYIYWLTAATLLILKIVGVLEWPWIWATAMLWFPLLLAVFAVIVHRLLYKYDSHYRLKTHLDALRRSIER